MPLEKVPGIQKQITRMARRAGKPRVVATQMLESMITNPVQRAPKSPMWRPRSSRARRRDAVGGTAAGQFPVEAVADDETRIAEEVRDDITYRSIIQAQRSEPEATGADAIADAARQIAETLDCRRSCAGLSRIDRAARCARAAEVAGSSRFRRTRPPGESSRWRGRAQCRRRGMHTIRTTWSIAPAAGPSVTVRQSGPAHHHRRRRAARHAGATNMVRIAFVGSDAAEEH